MDLKRCQTGYNLKKRFFEHFFINNLLISKYGFTQQSFSKTVDKEVSLNFIEM